MVIEKSVLSVMRLKSGGSHQFYKIFMSNKLNRKQLFRLVPARPFFTDYAPMVTLYYQKLHGKNGRGEPLDFSEQDIKNIKKGLKQLAADIKAADV